MSQPSGRTEKFKSLVFFDCSTTGLYVDKNDFQLSYTRDPLDFSEHMKEFISSCERCKFPPVTELSFVVVTRHVFEKNIDTMAKVFDEMDEGNPNNLDSIKVRMGMDVLTLCMDPNVNERDACKLMYKFGDKSPLRHLEAVIRKFATRNRATFAQHWVVIRAFLDNIPKPAVMIAHNGVCHDFRVLYGELMRYGLLAEGLPKGIYFADSMCGVINIEEAFFDEVNAILRRKSFQRNPWPTVRKSIIPEWIVMKKRLQKDDFQLWFGNWELLVNRAGRYKLETLYRMILEGERDFHWSQEDAEAVLQIALAYGRPFLDYIEEVAAPFPF